MDMADEAIVYFNPYAIEHKKLPPLDPEKVRQSFGNKNIKVYTSSEALMNDIVAKDWADKNLLLMSSGNFDGVDFKELANRIIK